MFLISRKSDKNMLKTLKRFFRVGLYKRGVFVVVKGAGHQFYFRLRKGWEMRNKIGLCGQMTS